MRHVQLNASLGLVAEPVSCAADNASDIPASGKGASVLGGTNASGTSASGSAVTASKAKASSAKASRPASRGTDASDRAASHPAHVAAHDPPEHAEPDAQRTVQSHAVPMGAAVHVVLQ